MNSILEPRPSGLPLPTVIQLHHERGFFKQFGGILSLIGMLRPKGPAPDSQWFICIYIYIYCTRYHYISHTVYRICMWLFSLYLTGRLTSALAELKCISGTPTRPRWLHWTSTCANTDCNDCIAEFEWDHARTLASLNWFLVYRCP